MQDVTFTKFNSRVSVEKIRKALVVRGRALAQQQSAGTVDRRAASAIATDLVDMLMHPALRLSVEVTSDIAQRRLGLADVGLIDSTVRSCRREHFWRLSRAPRGVETTDLVPQYLRQIELLDNYLSRPAETHPGPLEDLQRDLVEHIKRSLRATTVAALRVQTRCSEVTATVDCPELFLQLYEETRQKFEGSGRTFTPIEGVEHAERWLDARFFVEQYRQRRRERPPLVSLSPNALLRIPTRLLRQVTEEFRSSAQTSPFALPMHSVATAAARIDSAIQALLRGGRNLKPFPGHTRQAAEEIRLAVSGPVGIAEKLRRAIDPRLIPPRPDQSDHAATVRRLQPWATGMAELLDEVGASLEDTSGEDLRPLATVCSDVGHLLAEFRKHHDAILQMTPDTVATRARPPLTR